MTFLRALFTALALMAGPVGAQEPPQRVALEGAPHRVAPEGAPHRVVSMNLCTDQFALMLAAPGQLVSVSYVSADPVTSPMAAEAASYPLNHGSAEQIYLMRPDLVLAHTWTDPTALAMLRRLGVRVVQVPGVERLSDIPDRLATVGALLGRDAAAADLIAQFERDLAAIGALPPGPRAAVYGANGYTVGTGGLAHEVLTRGGFRNIAAEIAPNARGEIALELLVMAAPDLILRGQTYPGASQAEDILHHPALQALVAASAGLEMGPDWACGTPRIVTALHRLVQTRQGLEGAP